jgi:hypothetical protein
VVFHDDVSGERGDIRHDDVIAELHIVSHMHVGEQVIV